MAVQQWCSQQPAVVEMLCACMGPCARLLAARTRTIMQKHGLRESSRRRTRSIWRSLMSCQNWVYVMSLSLSGRQDVTTVSSSGDLATGTSLGSRTRLFVTSIFLPFRRGAARAETGHDHVLHEEGNAVSCWARAIHADAVLTLEVMKAE